MTAHTDWLNVTFPFPPHGGALPVAEFFTQLHAATAGCFGTPENRDKGFHGWGHSFRFPNGEVIFACGGQQSRALLYIPAGGCLLINDWMPLIKFLRDERQGRITRWDGAYDDIVGTHDLDWAVAQYFAGNFDYRGRKPKLQQKGNWLEPDGRGRTLEIGGSQNGKMVRIYERGKMLGDRTSPLVRIEVEFHNADREIPFDVLLNPADHLAGSFKPLSWISKEPIKIPTAKITDDIVYSQMVRKLRVQHGPLINVMMQREGNAERVVQLLRRDGVPRRLKATDQALRALGQGHKP